MGRKLAGCPVFCGRLTPCFVCLRPWASSWRRARTAANAERVRPRCGHFAPFFATSRLTTTVHPVTAAQLRVFFLFHSIAAVCCCCCLFCVRGPAEREGERSHQHGVHIEAKLVTTACSRSSSITRIVKTPNIKQCGGWCID